MASIPDPRTVGPRTVGTRTRDAFLASNWWAAAVRAVVAIVIGSIAILAPMVTVLGLVMIFAAYALVDGVFAIVLAVRGARAHERWGWLAVNGIVSVAAAVGAMIYPAITALVFAVLLGAWAVVSGAATIVAGLELGRDHGRWWLIGGGVIAAAFGLFVLFMPPAGMLAL
ncbi:MAG: rane protein, partial [Alphaproteobacteria bacterium]|nr:rane protein [Alphaproteobacteria bacterium]